MVLFLDILAKSTPYEPRGKNPKEGHNLLISSRIATFFAKFNYSNSLSYRLVRGVSWLMIGVVLGRTAMWLARIAAARIIGRVPLGEFGLIESTVGLFVNFAALGMSLAISKNLAECYDHDPARAGRILGAVCLVCGILFTTFLLILLFSTPYLATKLANSPQFLTSLRLGTLLAFQVPCGIAISILSAFQRFAQVASANIIQGGVTLALTILLAPRWGLDGFLLAYGGGYLLMLFYQLIVIRTILQRFGISLHYNGVRKEFPLFWRYGFPSTLYGMLAWPVNWATRAYLSRQPDGWEELGIYISAFSFVSVIIAASSMLYSVSLPVLSSAVTWEEKQRGIARMLFLFWSVALISIVPLILFSDTLVKVFLGVEFLKAGMVLAILSLSHGLRLVAESLRISLITVDRTWSAYRSLLFGEFAFLIFAFALIPYAAALGFAYAHLISSIVIILFLNINFKNEISCNYNFIKVATNTFLIIAICFIARRFNGDLINILFFILILITTIKIILIFKKNTIEKITF